MTVNMTEMAISYGFVGSIICYGPFIDFQPGPLAIAYGVPYKRHKRQ